MLPLMAAAVGLCFDSWESSRAEMEAKGGVTAGRRAAVRRWWLCDNGVRQRAHYALLKRIGDGKGLRISHDEFYDDG